MLGINRRSLLTALGLAPAAALPVHAARPARAAVRVLYTRLNGELHYAAQAALPTLAEEQAVTLRREPANPYDRRAIEVFAADGRKLGYVARIDNSAVARMMDAGERFAARIVRLDADRIDIRLVVDWLPG